MVLDYHPFVWPSWTPRRVIENLPEDLRDYVRFAATGDIRKGELSALRWHVLQGLTLHVPASICKNRKGRTLPLVGEMLAVVERQKVRRHVEVNGVIEMCPYIFLRACEYVPVGEFRKSWKSACRKAGRPGHFPGLFFLGGKFPENMHNSSTVVPKCGKGFRLQLPEALCFVSRNGFGGQI